LRHIPNFFFFFSRPKYLPPQKNRKKSGENTGKKKLDFSLSSALERFIAEPCELRVINLSAFLSLVCATSHARTLACPPLFRVFVVLVIRSITAIIIVKTREKMDQIRAVDQSRFAL
jgi:hypothetical protein